MYMEEALTFDDVLLKPKYAEIASRSEINTGVKINDLKFDHPIIPANMKSIMSFEMACSIMKSGGLAILHRFIDIEQQLYMAEDLIEMHGSKHLAVSVGVKDYDKENLDDFDQLGVKTVCIDVAHGDSLLCAEMVKYIKHHYPKMKIIAGNVATGTGARKLWELGADVVKVGLGSGSLCTTRIETGTGVPQMASLMEVSRVKHELLAKEMTKPEGMRRNYYFIADGGMKSAGDIVKGLCFADMVMVGNIFAGCEETGGEIRTINGQQYRDYVGSSTHKTEHIEGVEALVPAKGSYDEILTKLLQGLRSGLSYQGSRTLMDLRKNPQFVRITNAGRVESGAHDVLVVK